MRTKNLTIALDETLLEASKRYARLKGTSINEMFREFLQKQVVGQFSLDYSDELMDALDNAEGNSKNKRWSREDAYS